MEMEQETMSPSPAVAYNVGEDLYADIAIALHQSHIALQTAKEAADDYFLSKYQSQSKTSVEVQKLSLMQSDINFRELVRDASLMESRLSYIRDLSMIPMRSQAQEGVTGFLMDIMFKEDSSD
jgi:hypothetical protein